MKIYSYTYYKCTIIRDKIEKLSKKSVVTF